MQFSRKVVECELSPIRKFYPYQVKCLADGKKIYPLNIGQPDIRTPEQFFQALKAFDNPVVAYAPSPGMPVLIHKVQEYYRNLGMEYAEEDILITNGGSEALNFVLGSILNDCDEVLVAEPFYPNYLTFIKMAGGHLIPIRTTQEEGYRYASREKIEPLITDRTRAILISNPNNPTGVVLSDEELRTLADIAKEHDLFLISDEVYREFSYDTEIVTSVGQFEDIANHAVIIDSISKRYSACGARIGMILCKNRELMNHVLKMCQARLSVSTLDQLAAASIYDVDESYLAEIREEYRARRDTVCRSLAKLPGVGFIHPAGAFYTMVRLPVADAEDFLLYLLTEFEDNGETLMYAPGEGFYSQPGAGKNEFRLAYVLNCRDLERAIELLGIALERYQAKQA